MNKNIVFQQMKKQVCKAFVAATALLAVVACTNEEAVLEMPEEPAQSGQLPAGWVSARGRMDLSVKTFDGEAAQTRAEETDTWAEGDKIYFMIEVGQTKTPVVAVYSKVFSAWSFNYNASATIPASGTMKGCYLEGATSSDYSGATLSEDGIVYIDSKASYTYQNGEFAITVHLKPSYVRLRFAGTQGQAVAFSGLSRVTSFDAATYTFEQTPVKTVLEASDTAENEKYFTPYVYGYLNADNRIYIATEEGNTYGRTITASTLSAGESAWMTMPSENYIPKGWSWADIDLALNQTITVNGVTFNMIFVRKGNFDMGSTEYDNEQPVHSVTLTKSYYMGETEVTQELYKAVMNTNPSYYSSDLCPVERVSWNDCQTFITKLNSLTGLTFRLPTEAEWEFAARGGNDSQGYTYSGSNTIGNVACYSDNYSYGHNVVKTKSPNELGIYDMSGNVYEWCQDWYGSYSSGSQKDPTGPTSGSQRVLRGGGWSGTATCCRVAHRNYNTPTSRNHDIGFRLAL